MNDSEKMKSPLLIQKQCQYFVLRKKRLCRMTVRPGRQFCGEHEPDPKTEDGQKDYRIPCPNDPKHTCYASKLQKHLLVCNARPRPLPSYIKLNVNVPANEEPPMHMTLNQVPKETVAQIIDKINKLYDKYLLNNIETIEEQEIHETILADFQEAGRTESSLRHLRQASSLLRAVERAELVRAGTCYIELGAGKGQLSYYAWKAWCAAPARGCVLLVDRAALRHKRDNKLNPNTPEDDVSTWEGRVCRVRAELQHVRGARAPPVRSSAHAVGLAKHLCGVATDYALRCMLAEELRPKTRGVVMATCCHHQCRPAHILGAHTLHEMGITLEELQVMLRIVSWATCGHGRSRQPRTTGPVTDKRHDSEIDQQTEQNSVEENTQDEMKLKLTSEERAEIGRRGKALVDYARVSALREAGFDARLCYFVPLSVSPENVCIIATKLPQ